MKVIFGGIIAALLLVLAFGIATQFDWWSVPDCKLATRTLYCSIQDWQTLIAGLLALTAALMAARPVYQQLEEMRAQTHLQSYQLLRELSASIENERLIVDAIDTDVSVLPYIEGDLTRQAISKEWIPVVIKPLQTCFDELGRHKTALEVSGNKKWGDTFAAYARMELVGALITLRLDISKKIVALYALNGTVDPALSGQRISSAISAAFSPGFATLLQALKGAAQKFDGEAAAEVARLKPRLDQAFKRLTSPYN
jgi:hypothetical protein